MNKKVAFLLSIFCFAVVLAIGVSFFVSFRKNYIRSDVGLSSKKIERKTSISDKNNLNNINLDWDIVPNAKSYNLYWSDNPGVTKKSGNKIANVYPPFKFIHAKKGLTYYFVVTAINGSEESGESKEISFQVGK